MKLSFKQLWIVAVGTSVVLHLTTFGSITWLGRRPAKKISRPVKVSVVVEKKAEPEKAPEVVPPKPPPKKEKPKPKKTATQAPPKTPQKEAPPVQGIAADSMVKDGKGLAAPIGNTLLKEDEGKRLRADQVGALESDCSADARLVRGTVEIPQYTDEALDAGVHGVFVVDVYVDEKGNATQAEVRKKIGYGMDARVVAVVTKAKFEPRKNKVCTPIAGWAELKFSLVIP